MKYRFFRFYCQPVKNMTPEKSPCLISISDPAKCVYNHMRYRYYFDPPELLTCIISIRDHWHVGLYSDLITETPSICASNDQRTGALYSVAANLFGAVKIVLYRRTQTLIVRVR